MYFTHKKRQKTRNYEGRFNQLAQNGEFLWLKKQHQNLGTKKGSVTEEGASVAAKIPTKLGQAGHVIGAVDFSNNYETTNRY